MTNVILEQRNKNPLCKFDPKFTSYATTLDLTDLMGILKKNVYSLLKANIGFGFDNTYNQYKFIFLTGLTKAELEIPPFQFTFPLVMKFNEEDKCIFVDLRPYTNPSKIQDDSLRTPATLYSAITSRDSNSEFLINTAIIINNILSGNLRLYTNLTDIFVNAWSALLTNLINSLCGLDIVEEVKVDIILKYIGHMKSIDSFDYSSHHETVIQKIFNSKTKVPVNKNFIVDAISNINIENYISLDDIVDNVKNSLPEIKSRLIMPITLQKVFGNLMFGINANSLIKMSTECMSIWIGLLYHIFKNPNYKKSRIVNILQNVKGLKLKDYVEKMNIILSKNKFNHNDKNSNKEINFLY